MNNERMDSDRECADRAVRNLMGLHVLNRLGPADSARVERHLLRCSSCKRDDVDLRRVTSALDLLSAEDVAEMLAARTGGAPESSGSYPQDAGRPNV